MADFTDAVEASLTPEAAPYPEIAVVELGFGGGGAPTISYVQRIWDTNVGWCQYTKTSIDTAPLFAETQPNHTNNLVTSTHQLLAEI